MFAPKNETMAEKSRLSELAALFLKLGVIAFGGAASFIL
jgi:chromate transport protein ChrA